MLGVHQLLTELQILPGENICFIERRINVYVNYYFFLGWSDSTAPIEEAAYSDKAQFWANLHVLLVRETHKHAPKCFL